jgi:Rho termination factor, N-terminal domain
MKMSEIRERAERMGVNPRAMNKQDLIRAIQAQEGYDSCFKTEWHACDQYDCCWRSDCKPGEMADAIEAV